ncbi:YadA-like family protein [Glaesserella parasuis]|nr:YadA-like family protein [Glaesserella parasuis]
MNKIFRVIWSHAQQAWVVVSELVKSHGKSAISIDKRISPNFSAVLLEQQNGFSLSPVTKAILVGLLGLSFADFAYSRAVLGGGSATDSNDYSNTVVGDSAVALSVNDRPHQEGDYGTDSVVIGYHAKTKKGGHLTNPGLGNASRAVVIGGRAQGVEGAVAIGWKTNVSKLYGVAVGRDATVGGEYAVAIGSNEDTQKTQALGTASIAIGRQAKAEGYASLALSMSAQALGTSSVAMMYDAKATGVAAVAVGRETRAGNHSTALGGGANATGNRSIAIGAHKDANSTWSGSGAEATGEDSIALGTDATASAIDSIAIGKESKAEGDRDSVAIGKSSNAKAYGTALGSSTVAHTDALAAGNSADATKNDSTALGAHTQATGRAAVAIGSSAIADSNGDVTRSIASARNTIAIGGGKASQIEAISIGAKSQATQTQSIAIGSESSASAAQAVTIGSNTVASGYGAISIGGDDLDTTKYQSGTADIPVYSGTTASGKASVAIGGKSSARGEGSIVVGPVALATNDEGIAIGAKSMSTADYGIAVGGSATAGSYAVAVGKSSQATATGTSAFGENAYATADRATALGNNSKADVENGVALGYMSKTTRNATNNAGWKQDTSAYSALNNNVRTATHAAVAVGNDTTGSIVTRQITGVAAGSQDTDAVNLAQLKALTLNIKGQDNTTGDVTLSTETLELVGEKGIATTVDQANGKTKIKIRGSTTTYKADGGMSNNKLSNDTIGYVADSPSNTVSILTTYDWEDPNGGNAQKYKGENIQSIRKENGDFYLGIKESPTFKTVTASESVTVTGGPTISTNGINMGNKQITNLAEGTQNDHAVNKGQLDNATVTYFHTNTGDRTQGEGEQATNKGKITDKAGAKGNYSVTAGVNTKAEGANSIAIGYAAKTTNQNAVTVGASSQAGDHSVAYGYEARAIGTGSVAVGEKAVTNENINRATALGNNSIVTVGGGVALGYGSSATTAGNIEGERQAHSVVTGQKLEANGFKSTRNVDGNDIGAVSVGGTTIKRQITNVAAGTELTDAVNVAQLKSLTMKIGGDQNTGTPAVGIWDGKLEVKGTNGEIKTSASGSTITVSLDDAIKAQLNNVRAGSLTFKGEKTETGATNDVSGQKWNANEDKTVTIASNETYESNGVRYKGDNVEIYRKNLNNGNTEFHVLMKDAPTFSSVQYGDNGPKITSAGSNLKVTGADGSSPVKITNVANGEQDNDAVNFSQLNPLITKITNLESKQIKYFSVNSTGGGNVNNDGATKSNAIAIGRDATASQNQAVALGKGATSNGLGAVAIGGQFDTEEEERTYSMNQDGSREVHSNAGLWAKVQYNAEKKEGEVGKTRTTQATSASGMYSVAIGSKTRAEGNGALALGYAAYAKGGGVALGLGAAVGESDGISIGTFSATKAVASIALGYFAKAENKHSLAFGRDSKAAKDGGVALGFKSEATIEGGKAGTKQDYSAYTGTQGAFTSTATVGNDSVGAVSVGKADGTITRQIVGVAAGTNDTDAANVAQLKSLTMKIGGNTNETTQPKVGLWESTLNVKGDNGLTSHASGDTITVKLTDEIKQKIDGLETKVNNQGITFKGNTGQTGSIKLGDTLKVEGVTDETVVTASTDKLALGLAQKVKDEIAGKMSSFKIKANDTGEQEITNGNTIVFKNGKNINVTRNDKELTFATTETPEFTSVQYGNDGPKITKDNDGNLKVTKADGNAPVKITNVAEGTETNDAVNLSQLTSATQTYFHTNTGLNTQGVGNENTNLGSLEEKAGATGKYAVTAGVNTKATSNQAVAIGKDTKATASSAIAIGSGKPENPNGLNLLKARYNPTTKEVDAGHRFDPTDTETVASGSMSLAIGGLSKATGHVSVALGAYSYALDHEAIAIGSRTAASGAAAVAIGSLSAASGGDAVAIGWGAKARGDFSAALGLNAKALNKNAIAIGNGATAGIEKDTTNISTVAIGESAVASHKETIAIGKGAKATAEKAISIGTGNTVSGAKSGAIGDPNTVSGAASYVMGNDNTVTHTKAFVLGNNVTTGADDSVYLGDSSAVNTGDSSGGVTSAVASGEINGITYGNFAATTPVGVVTVGAATKERRIQNVAAGKISATSTDAINGSQLYLTNNVIGNIAKTIKPILGGDADYKTSGDEAGKFTMTNIGATGKNNIHDAIIAAKSVVKAGKNISSVDTKNETDGSKTYTVNAYKTTVAAKEGDNIINIEGGNAGDDNVLAYKIGVNKDEIKKLVTAAPSNIKYKANSTGEQTVSLTEGLDFTNGTHTKATVGANGVVTFDLNESAVNKLNMVETVKSGNEDKITVTSNNNNTSGGKEFVVNLTEKVTSDIAKGVEAKNTVDTQGITFKGDNNGAGVTKKLGETLMIEGGDNITTKAENDKVTVNLDNNVNLTANGSVKFGDDKNAQLNKDGLIVKTDDNPTASIEVTKTGIKAGDKKITNVANGDVSASSTDAVTGQQLHNLVKVNGQAAESGGSVNFVDGNGTTVTKENDGKIKVNVNTSELSTSLTNATDGKVELPNSQNENKFATAKSVAEAVNNSYWTATSDTTGTGVRSQGNQASVAQVKPSDQVIFKAGDNLVITQDGTGNRHFTYALASALQGISSIANGNENVGTKISLSPDSKKVDVNNAKISNVATPEANGDAATKKYVDDTNTVVAAGDGLTLASTVDNDKGGKTYTLALDKTKLPSGSIKYKAEGDPQGSEAKSVDLTTGFNFKNGDNTVATTDAEGVVKVDLNSETKNKINKIDGLEATTNKGLKFVGEDNSKTDEIKLGNEVTITGGANINTTASGSTVTVNLEDNVKLTEAGSLTFGDDAKNVKLTKDGLTLKTDGNKDIQITKAGIKAGDQKITNVADGVISDSSTDAVIGKQLHNLIKVNSDVAESGGSVNFVDGTGTTVSSTNGEIKVNVSPDAFSTTITHSNGKVVVPDDETKLVTAKSVAEAVNNVYWKATSGVDGGTQAEGNTPQTANVKAGDQVTFKAGKNLSIKQTDKDFTYALQDNISLTKVTTGNTEMKNDSITITPVAPADGGPAKSPVKLTASGLDNGGNKIINVANGNVASGSTDAVTGDQLHSLTEKVNKGWKVAISGNTTHQTVPSAHKVEPDSTVTFDGGSNIKLTQENGKITVATTDTPSFNSVTLTQAPSEDNHAVTKSYVDTQVGGKGQNFIVGAGNDKTPTITVNSETDKKRFDVVGHNHIETAVEDRTVKVGLSSDAKNKIDKIDTIETQANKKLSFAGDSGTAVEKALGETVNIAGSSNIETKAENNGVTVSLKTDVNLTDIGSVKFGDDDKNAKLTKEGLTLKTADSKDIQITKEGIKAGDQKITNVANGSVADNSKDAVTGHQLHNLIKVNGNVAIGDTSDSVNFANSTTANVTATGGTIKVDVNTGALSTSLTLAKDENVNNGKVATPVEGDKNKFVTAESVANAINETFWKVTSDVDGGTRASNTQKTIENIKAGDLVTLKAGDNLVVKQSNKDFTFSLNNKLNLGSEGEVKFASTANGSAVLNKDGLTVGSGNNIVKVTKEGIDAGNKVISNVATPVNDNDATNKKYVDDGRTTVTSSDNSISVTENAQTTGVKDYDIKVDYSKISSNINLKYTANDTDKKEVKLSDGLIFKNTDNITASVEDSGVVKHTLNSELKGINSIASKTTDGTAEATKIELSKDANDKKVTLNEAKVTGLKDGDVSANSKDAVTGKQLHNFIKVGDSAVAKDGVVKFANGSGTTINTTTEGTIKVDVNTTALTMEETGAEGQKTKTGKVATPSEDDKSKLVTAETVANAINKSGFKLISGADGGTNSTEDSLKTNGEMINPGDTLKVIAGKNINLTHSTSGNIKVATVDTPMFTSVQFGDNGPKISKSDSGDLKLGKGTNGSEAVKITNVADGDVKDNSADAVTGKQLHNYLKVDGASAHKDGSINFADGTTTSVNADNGVVKIEVNTTALSTTLTTNNGSVTNPTNTEGTKFATASSVASAINDVYWSATSGTATGGTQDGTAQTANVKAGNTVTFKAGKNLTIKQDGTENRDFTYSLNSALKDITSIANGTEGTGTKITLSSNSKEMNVGGAKISNVAAPTESTDAATKKYVDDSRTTVTSGSDVLTITDANANDQSKTNKAYTITLNADKLNSAANLSYKANNKDGKTTPLSTGLDFTNTTNITASIADNGVVKHTLNSELKSITSIASKEDGTGTKVTLSAADNDKKVTLNDAKLTGLTDGKLAADSKDAVTGKQLKDLADKIGVGLETNSTTAFKTPTFTKLKASAADTTEPKEAKTVVEALEATRSKVNEGLKFKGEETDDAKTITKQLGETLQFVSGNIDQTADGATTHYKGENLAVISDGSKIVVGLKEKPEFKEVTVKDGNNTTTVGATSIKVGDTTADDDKPVTITAGENNEGGSISNLKTTLTTPDAVTSVSKPNSFTTTNAATLGDVLNAGWNLEANGSAVDFVQPYDKVNFTGEKGVAVTSVVKDGKATIKVSSETEALEIVEGKAKLDTVKQLEDAKKALQEAQDAGLDTTQLAEKVNKLEVAKDKVEEKLVTAKEVADAINESGWKTTSDVEGSGKRAESTTQTTEYIKAGELVTFKAGDNLIIKQDGKNFTYSLNPALTGLTSAEFKGADGEAKTNITKEGITITPATPTAAGKSEVKLTASGLNNGGNKITNVAEGTDDNDAVNVSQLNTKTAASKTEVESKDKSIGVSSIAGSSGQKIYDLSVNNAVITSSADFKTVEASKNGNAFATAENVAHAINTATAAATTEVTSTDGSVNILETRGDNGQNIYDLEVVRSALSISDDGKEVTSATTGDAFATGDDVANVVNKAAASARTEIKDGKNTKASIDQTGVDGQDIYKIDVEGELTGITSIANGNNDAKDNGTKISLSEDPNNKVVTLNDAKLTGLVDGNVTSTSKEAITGNQLKDLADKVGVELAADSTTLFKKPEFTKLKANKDTDVTAKEAKTVVEALEETRTTVNKGLIFVGEDNLNPLTKQLGETLTITSGDITKDGVEYKGSNLRVEADGTNIEIGLKENPEFKAITVKDGDQTTTVTNNTVTIGAKDQNAKPITISATDNANTISGLTTAIADPDTADTKAKSKDKPNNLTTTNAATLGDVLNTGWNLKANDDALDFVRPYDSVKFQDGAGTFVTTATDGKESIIQIDIDNGTLTTTTDGKVVGMVTAEKSKELTDNIIDAETELRDAKDALTELGDNATEEAKNTAIQAIKDAEAKVQKAYDDADKAGLNKVATAQNVAEAINNSGWRVTAGKTTGVVKGEKETLVKPSDLVTFKAGDNIVIEQDGSNFTFALSDTVKTNAITVGEKGADGKDGVDGTIGVNGKDGSAVVINGKDGSIGLNGKDGVNGVTIKGDQGPAGVDGKDGETKTRIVYEYTDPKSPNTPIKEEIATLKDGQKYSGDNYVADNADTVIKKKLNERLEIKGGVTDETKLSDNNIGVIAENGVLNVRLAKNINLGNDGSVTTGNTKVDNNGITIKKPADAGDGKSDVKLTASGLDNGGNTIINVAAGVADTDAVNVKQLKDTVNAAATDVVSNDGSIDVMGEVDAVTGKNTYDLSVKTSGLTSSPDKKTVNADVTGKAFATAETVANAINTATAAATSEVISTNGSVSINEMTGDKGQNIYDLEVTRSELSISDDGKTVTSGTAGEAFVTGDDVANVVNKAAASARTEIKDGKNTKASIDQTGLDGHDIYKIDVEGDLTGITSIANGNNDAKDNGTKISLSNDPDNKTVDVHGAKITNVAAGKADTDAVNVSQLTAAAKGAKTEVESSDASVEVTENRGDNGQTVYDLAVVKSKLNAAEDKRTVAAETKGNAFVTGEEVAKAINTTTAAARTEVTDGRNTQVVATTGENGQDIYNVSVSGLPMEYATEDGKSIINMGGNFYLEEPAADGSIKLIPVVNAKGKFSAKTQNPDGSVTLKPLAVKVNLANEAPMVLGNVAEGVADTDAVNVKQLKSAKTEVESTDHSVVIKERQGDNQQIVYDLTVAKTKLTASEDKRTISAEDKGNHFATGDEVAAAINTATAAARTEVEAGKNVKVTSKTGANGQNIYNVSVSGDLSDITSISNGDTKVSLGKDKQGNPVVNMNGARITNIGDGSAEGDVVNVRQLNKVVSSVNAGFNQLSKDIGRVDVNARAGIASAGAMANLSQVYLPGKSAISVSGAQYRGQAAYAIGYSRISDNGKWLIRASVSSNTQRDTMIGGGASFVW